MHQRKCRLHTVIGEIGEELLQLWSCQHSLVHKSARRQRREVCAHCSFKFVLNSLANNEQLAIEVNTGCTSRVVAEELAECWHDGASRCTEAVGVNGYVAPTERTQSFFFCDCVDSCCRTICIGSCLGKECNSRCVRTGGRQLNARNRTHKCIGHLNEDSRAVTSVWLGTCSAAVFHVGQCSETKGHNLAATNTFDVGHK